MTGSNRATVMPFAQSITPVLASLGKNRPANTYRMPGVITINAMGETNGSALVSILARKACSASGSLVFIGFRTVWKKD